MLPVLEELLLLVYCTMSGIQGYAVSQLVEALRYKSDVAGSIPDGVIGTGVLISP